MGKGKRTLFVGFFVNVIVVFLFFTSVAARPNVYYGRVVGIEFSMLRVNLSSPLFPSLPAPACHAFGLDRGQ